jgi:vacuolar-type H+-ATPase subunit I/STV1
MFTPERMHQINVMVFETEVDDVAKTIVRLGILHLVQLDDAQPWATELRQFEAGRAASRIDRLYSRVINLMKDLDIRELPLEEGDTGLLETSITDLDEMEKEIDEMEKRVSGLVLRRKELEVHLERMQGILNEISPLTAIGLPPQKAPYTFLEVHYGHVSAGGLELIREKFAPLAAVVIPLTQRDGRELILLIGLKTDRLKIKRIMRDAAFEDIEMPA